MAGVLAVPAQESGREPLMDVFLKDSSCRFARDEEPAHCTGSVPLQQPDLQVKQ